MLVLVLMIAGVQGSPYIEDHELEPYQPSHRAGRSADSYDTTQLYSVNQPIDSSSHGHKRCWNTGLFAVISAIEIAYTMLIGEVRKFSEQEVLDCFYKGCNPADSATLLRHLIVQDRLAKADSYTPYQSKVDMCRSAYAPDNLGDLELQEVVSVSVDSVEEAVREHGSVIACMDMTSSACPDYRDYEGGVLDGSSTDSCNHVVSIVGYGPDHYKVKEHRGTDWGEDGYFRIRRGGNACGVEFRMVALRAGRRDDYKKLTSEGCPLQAPVFCKELRTCTTAATSCVTPLKAKGKRAVVEDVEDVEHVAKRAAACVDQPRYACDRYAKMCGTIPKVAARCPRTCGLCKDSVDVYSGKCKDDANVPCARYIDFCKKSPTVRLKCPASCKVPDADCDTEDHPMKDRRPKPVNGQCYIPTVANGSVYKDGRKVTGGMLDFGERLIIQCEAGYVLSGKESKCGVQHVYGPDSRLMQSCEKVNSESFTGPGYDYKGMASEPVSQNAVCDNWNQLILTGRFHYFTTDVAVAKALMFGNHNYCRNSAAMKQPVPFCIAGSTSMGYCKKYPGCQGLCEGGETDDDPYCDEDAATRCPYVSEYKLNRNKDAWHYCKKSCCTLAGC